MRFKFLTVFLSMFVLTGCSSLSSKPTTVNNLQIKMAHMERRLNQNTKEIEALKMEPLSSSSSSSSPKVNVSYDDSVSEDIGFSSDKYSRSSYDTKDAEVDRIVRVDVDVKTLQRALSSSGYYSGSIDGKLGANTKSGIYQFQKDHDLEADGIVGKKTWSALKSYLD